MDIQSFTIAFELITKAVGLYKGVREALPKSPQGDAAEKALAEAETAIAIAHANAAKELGYDLCLCTFPPQIKLTPAPGQQPKCPKCGDQCVPDNGLGGVY